MHIEDVDRQRDRLYCASAAHTHSNTNVSNEAVGTQKYNLLQKFALREQHLIEKRKRKLCKQTVCCQ